MQEVRLRFSKEDRAKYIGHLDVNRVISRALKRANIPIWYTEGFNPHPYMSFSLPLSLGVESLCESVDLRLVEPISNEEIKQRMNNCLPSGIRIIDVFSEFSDCNDIAFSDYVYTIDFKNSSEAMTRIKNVFDADEIIALKKGKSGRKRILKETNIKEFIESYSLFLQGESVILQVRLAAGPNKNLNPSLLFDTIIRLIDMDFEWKSIRRVNLLDKDYREFI